MQIKVKRHVDVDADAGFREAEMQKRR